MLNLYALWHTTLWGKFLLISFILAHIGFLSFTWFEHATPIAQRMYPSTSNIGIFVDHAHFYLHWVLILLSAIFFLCCPKQPFLKIITLFGFFIAGYFFIYVGFAIGSIMGVALSTLYFSLMNELHKDN